LPRIAPRLTNLALASFVDPRLDPRLTPASLPSPQASPR